MGMFTLESAVSESGDESRASILDRYTETARRAFRFAWQESQRRGDSVIDVCDLLCGLTIEENSRAVRVGKLKENALYLRWLVGVHTLPGKAIPEISELDETELELDTETQRAVTFASMEADRDHEQCVDTDHLLRGLLRFPNKAQFALLKTEIDLHGARIDSKQDRAKYAAGGKAPAKSASLISRHFMSFLVPSTIGLALYLYLLVQGIAITLPHVAK
jgi:ATP-dependent Clp protease ATP-binding subunit ClpA